MAREGLRTLVVAKRALTEEQYQDFEVSHFPSLPHWSLWMVLTAGMDTHGPKDSPAAAQHWGVHLGLLGRWACMTW